MAIVDFMYQLWTVLFTSAERFLEWVTRPMLPQYAIDFLDPLLPGIVFDVLNISSLSEISYVWILGAGLIGYCIYSFVTWLLNIVT